MKLPLQEATSDIMCLGLWMLFSLYKEMYCPTLPKAAKLYLFALSVLLKTELSVQYQTSNASDHYLVLP